MSKTYTEPQVAELIVGALAAASVTPDDESIDARGLDYGWVRGWWLDESKTGAVIEYGNNAETNYTLSDTLDDLPCWLLEDGDGRGDIAAICNARDTDPDEVSEDYAEPVRIIRRRDYYGSTCNYEYVVNLPDLAPQEWESAAKAREWITDKESECYYTSHNESGAPTYFIVPA